MHVVPGKPGVTLLQAFGLAIFVSVIAWSASRLVDSYRDSGVTVVRDHDQDVMRAQLAACRDRELDDVKSRLREIEMQKHE